jgi:hypothetical protein
MTGGTFKSGQATLPTPNSTSSFWHSEPSKILLGHRTTDHLPTKADVVIIGSGIAGTFAAHYLAAGEHGRDINVVMLEAREACWGATGRVSFSSPEHYLHSDYVQVCISSQCNGSNRVVAWDLQYQLLKCSFSKSISVSLLKISYYQTIIM